VDGVRGWAASAPRQVAVPSRFFNAAKSVLRFILQQEPAGTIRREPSESASAGPYREIQAARMQGGGTPAHAATEYQRSKVER
jgi:hypothetical protein